MPKKEVITVPGFKGLGPYSLAVRSAGLLFVSGQPGINSATGEAVGTTFEAQARQAFKNLEAVLKAGGSDLSLVVNTTVSIADMAFFPELNKLFLEFFPENPPARMASQVPLPKGLLISIGCVAAVKE
jgi:2-iminobutanoate/2-iminopropanoate deaminase